MKKIYLSAALCGLAFVSAQAQRTSHELNVPELTNKKIVKGKQSTSHQNLAKNAIWLEEFDVTSSGGGTFTTTNGDWTTAGVDADIWKHSFFTTSGEWSTNTPAFLPPSAANGFMLFDSDSVNWAVAQGNQSLYETFTGELISPQIDLSAEPSAMLMYHQDFRYCCSQTHNLELRISTDNGVTWGAPYDLTAGLGANDNFQNSMGDNTEHVVNISAEAAGQMVRFKFTWDGNTSGNSHYFWAIDDVCIVEWPANDLQMTASWVVGENNGGVEYGRTPEDHVDANYTIGSQMFNFGSATQTNLTWTADFNTGAITSSGTHPSLATDSTTFIENLEAVTLTEGTYAGDYEVSSTEETAGAYFVNNVGIREFEITPPTTANNSMYSQDGFDVYTNSVASSIGTASFGTDSHDGLVIAALYHIKQTADVSGIRVVLHSSTVEGGEIYGSIKDTSLFWANDMTSTYTTAPVTVNSMHIADGYVDLSFPAGTQLNAGVYYAAVELYSNGGSAHIRVRDDETVAQPFDASAIYIPGDQSYTNGTASAVRLLMGDSWLAVDENTVEGVSIYPNPSEGIVNITNDNNVENTITVHDLAGRVVLTTTASAATTIDLSGNGTGVYTITVENANGSMVERVVIK